MAAIATRPRLNFGTKLWLGLVAYIFGGDVYALLNGKETFTEAFHRAILHPRRRWLVLASWVFTTKHLFFYRFLSWLDPFAVIGFCVMVIKKIRRIT